MAQNYFSIVTHIGRNKLALSAAGGAAVTITHFAIGDGNGAEVNPTAASTALVREVWRTPVESVVIDPLNPSAVLVTSIIPTAVGGWWMREFGIFDVDGDMVAVAKPVSQYKPTALEGQLEDIRYEFQIIIGETANVTMLVDPSVLLASRDFVEKRKVPVAQLSLTPWVPIKSMTVIAPPTNPAAWDTYIIPTDATGAWAGQAQKLAEWNGSAWNIVTPPEGHGVSLPNGRVFERVGGAYIEKPALDAQSGKWNYAAATGTANALVVNLDPAPQSMPTGMKIRVLVATTNTGAATIAVNGAAAVAIRYADGSDLFPGELVAGRTVDLIRQPNGVWTVLTPTEGFLRLTTKGARDSQINVPLASDIGTTSTVCAQVTITGATYIEATGAGSIVNIGSTLGDTVLYMDIFDVAANATIITGPQAAASSVNNEKAAVYNRVIGRGFDKSKTYRVRVLASKASNFGQVNIANVNIFAMHD
ncbi:MULTISPECIES: phage tail protein [unclassified Brucella]|uniref:phage tail protein n=1 Tax=unclassified Brucella TaxID=2632610 RepID=UPI00097289FD|nr:MULTISPECIES: phage tail protein [unclassified Brucella]APX70546.1 hypothetical protein BKD03_15440 [Brucella sp. 09RB8471]MRN79877.1 DUF2793 domain-containing protein [Brucella sp. 10RB9210]